MCQYFSFLNTIYNDAPQPRQIRFQDSNYSSFFYYPLDKKKYNNIKKFEQESINLDLMNIQLSNLLNFLLINCYNDYTYNFSLESKKIKKSLSNRQTALLTMCPCRKRFLEDVSVMQ